MRYPLAIFIALVTAALVSAVVYAASYSFTGATSFECKASIGSGLPTLKSCLVYDFSIGGDGDGDIITVTGSNDFSCVIEITGDPSNPLAPVQCTISNFQYE